MTQNYNTPKSKSLEHFNVNVYLFFDKFFTLSLLVFDLFLD